MSPTKARDAEVGPDDHEGEASGSGQSSPETSLEIMPKQMFEAIKRTKDPNFYIKDFVKFQETRNNFNRIAFTWVINVSKLDMYQYDGLDLTYIYGYLCNRSGTLEQMVLDVKEMICIFLMRGNNVVKMRGSMAREGVQVLDNLISKYNLKPNLSRNDRRKTITLSRVAMCFPVFVIICITQIHKTKSPAIRPCLDLVHCVLRQPILATYLTHQYCPHAATLNFASMVILGSVIGDKDDTLGQIRKYNTAAIQSQKTMVSEIEAKLNELGIKDAPQNWNEIGRSLEEELSPRNDNRLVIDVASRIEKILFELIPPPSWHKYIKMD